MREPENKPFQPLGGHLKYLREQSHQSLAEVSGAVEIDEAVLERIEAGLERPAEDVLLLLISYFDMKDQEAVQLWEMAGYNGEIPEQIRPNDDVTFNHKNVVMLLAMDMRTVYTDGVEVVTNNAGVTINFAQTTGHNKTAPVARVGMSFEQAKQVAQAIEQALLKAKYQTGPRLLPPQGSNGSAAN
ncbi:MAG: helix-turn-helix transcriptional regulator [Patescibacteria group bacterium]|nr:helix-turn-helix transcriptional regulator [Patescibacteria group bacterium]